MEPTVAPKTETFFLRNYWENKVMERTKDIISKMNVCHCEKCYFDICALVLNKLPPQYVTTRKGDLMMKVPTTSAKSELELTILITKYAKMVSEKPMH